MSDIKPYLLKQIDSYKDVIRLRIQQIEEDMENAPEAVERDLGVLFADVGVDPKSERFSEFKEKSREILIDSKKNAILAQKRGYNRLLQELELK